MENKITLVLGASLKPNRYSNLAIQRLRRHNITTFALGLRTGQVADVLINTIPSNLEGIHTVTLYLNPARQKEYFDYILSLAPSRVIFNPGTENPELMELLDRHSISYEIACTLTLLATGQY